MADFRNSDAAQAGGNQVDKLSEFQRTRQVILDLLGFILTSDRDKGEVNPDLWKLHIDHACERIEEVYRG